jgi:hypothetical protein
MVEVGESRGNEVVGKIPGWRFYWGPLIMNMVKGRGEGARRRFILTDDAKS